MINSSSDAPQRPHTDLPWIFLWGILFFVPHFRQRIMISSVIVNNRFYISLFVKKRQIKWQQGIQEDRGFFQAPDDPGAFAVCDGIGFHGVLPNGSIIFFVQKYINHENEKDNICPADLERERQKNKRN
jgi:hypothetical protein